jgi:BTB/POZ domain/BTB And C-terminal Kelch
MGASPLHAFCDYTSGTRGLVSDLACLQADTLVADVVLVAGAEAVRLPAHSSVLSARCPSLVPAITGFLSKYHDVEGNGTRSENLELAFPSISPRTLHTVLIYIYSGRIRLSSSNVFLVLLAAEQLSMQRLSNIASHHVRRTTDVSHILNYLVQSLEFNLTSASAYLVSFIARNTEQILSRDEFVSLPTEAVSFILKQESLSASESDIWYALVRWACVRASIPVRVSLSSTSQEDLCKLRPHLRDFMQPGYLRILNLDVGCFANEVEPLAVISTEESLLKYRFDATAELVSFDDAFPMSRTEFLSRIRQRSALFQSISHPHQRGVTEKIMVCMPSWTRQTHVDFDLRCRLGRYADLSFYRDEDCTEKISSLQSVFAAHRVSARRADTDSNGNRAPRLSFPLRRFWFMFYAPGNFAPAWGYAFRVTPSIV